MSRLGVRNLKRIWDSLYTYYMRKLWNIFLSEEFFPKFTVFSSSLLPGLQSSHSQMILITNQRTRYRSKSIYPPKKISNFTFSKVGAYYNGPKFKCQPESGTGRFSYKIWTKKPKQKICKYAYLRIFSLTTSQSPKLIPKAYLKWECPYLYSKLFLKSFRQYLKK